MDSATPALPGRVRENVPREAPQRTEMEEVHVIRTEIVGPNSMACKLTLDLVWSRIATNELFRIPDLIVAVVVYTLAPRPLVLARGARFVATLGPRGIEPCDATVRPGTLADEPAPD